MFLLSRAQESWLRDKDNARAVTHGLASRGRLITAAAAIMVAVFLAFVPSTEVVLKLIGVGMASAILLDATVVRLVLLPATMHLLGGRNWWLPRRLDRRLPSLHLKAVSTMQRRTRPRAHQRAPRIESGLPGSEPVHDQGQDAGRPVRAAAGRVDAPQDAELEEDVFRGEVWLEGAVGRAGFEQEGDGAPEVSEHGLDDAIASILRECRPDAEQAGLPSPR